MQAAPHATTARVPMPPISQSEGNERRIGVIDLGAGSYVRIMATPDVSPEDALIWAEEIISLQRKVLAKRRATSGGESGAANVELEKSSEDA